MCMGPVCNWFNLLLGSLPYLTQWQGKVVRAGCSQNPWFCCFSFFLIWAVPTAMTPDFLHSFYRRRLCTPSHHVLLFSDHSWFFMGRLSRKVRVWKFEFPTKNGPYGSPIGMCYGSVDSSDHQHSSSVFKFLIGPSVAEIFGWYPAYSKVSF